MSYRLENDELVIVQKVNKTTMKSKITRLTHESEEAQSKANYWANLATTKKQQADDLRYILSKTNGEESMISKEQQRGLDALTAMAYAVADGKVKFADYREAEKAYVKKYGGY